MNLLSRFALLFLVLTLGLGGAFWLGHRYAAQELASTLREDARDRSQRLNAAISLHARPLETMVSSYAWWNDMVKFVEKPDPSWAAKNIDNIVGIPNGGDAVWVVNNDLQLIHTIDSDYARRPLPFPHPDVLKPILQSRYTFSYFTLINGKLWQVFGAAVQSGDFWRHETPVHGFVLLGQEWDESWLAPLNSLVGARVTLSALDSPTPPGAHRQVLNGVDGQPLIALDAFFNFNALESTHRTFDLQMINLGVAALAALAITAAFLAVAVLRPLGRISRSLESRVPTHLTGLLNARSEFGEIARLVAGQLRWGRMLEDEMQRQLERTNPEQARREVQSNEALRLRLSANIHDGPVQSIYAAGLQLAAMQTSAEQGHAPAPEQFTAVTKMLQHASSDLRNLILDLEPEELRERDLETALQRLERHMQHFAQCSFELQTGENLIDGLTRSAQTELYFICRELASNAIRHARPRHASLTFSAQSGFLRLEWRNDGVTPRTEPTAGGNGLRNIERRIAELDGTVRHGPDGDSGWRLDCEIPFTSLSATPLLPR
jgi:signal transduction histidine kinase